MSRPLYALRVPHGVAELIRSLHPQIKRKLRAALEQLAAEPRSGKALKGELDRLWSFRVGRFRIIYRVATGRRIDLVTFGPRERIYEETYRLVARGR